MIRFFNFAAFFIISVPALTAKAEAQPQSSKISGEIFGEVRDQRGDLIAGAQVSLTGAANSIRNADSDARGRFRFDGLTPGDYMLKVAAQGFAAREERVTLMSDSASRWLTITLCPAIRETLDVSDDRNAVSLDPDRAAGAQVLKEEQLRLAPDDPDQFLDYLQLLSTSSGSAPGQAAVTVDGFTHEGRLPPKSAIREVRINSNIFSAEYDKPPYRGGRIDIYTKPGASAFHGSGFFHFNNAAMNARDVFAPARPPVTTRRYGLQFGGPIIRRRAGFQFDFEARDIDEAATVNAVALDRALRPASFTASVATPKLLLIGSARADWQATPVHTFIARYDANRDRSDNQGVGGFDLPARAYDGRIVSQSLRFSGTSAISKNLFNEARIGLTFNHITQRAASNKPAIMALGAFTDGGASMRSLVQDEWRVEFTDNLSSVAGRHSLKLGAQIFGRRLNDAREENSSGAFVFGGAVVPPLDADGRVVIGADAVNISGLEQYRRALLGLPGGAPTRFSISRGNPIIALMILSIFAPACSSAASGERMAPNQTSLPAETLRVAVAADRQPERQAATAQDARLPLPVLPLIVHYEYVPHYFVQWLNDHPQYTRIEAAVTDSASPIFNLMLTEKGSGRRVNYCNAEARLKAMAQAGQEARLTKIDYRATNDFGQAPAHEFSFTDERGQVVRWRFTLAAPVSERGAGLTPQEGGAGLMLIYRELGTAAGEGTAAQIGAKVCQAEPWTEISAPPYFVAYRGAYSDGIGIGALLPGQESWRVTAPPKDLNEGAQWTLTCDRGRTRQLRIAATRGDELTILEVGGPLALQARKTPAGFALRSITLTSRSKTMRISFTPELDLAAGSAAPVNFQIDQNGHNKIAHGSVSVETRGAAASLRWTFKAPDWAKSRLLNSTVTISDNKQCDRLTRGKSAVFEPLQTAREQPSPYSNQATVMERRETKDQVWAAIDSLPEHERETVMLFYIGGYSQREVSEFLGATAPTIRKRLFSARRRLREMLTEIVADSLRSRRPSRDESFATSVMEMLTAARTGEVNRVGELLRQNRRLLNARDWLGNTALIMAVNSGHPAVAELLFKAGVRPDIHEAAAIGLTERVAELLREDASRLDSFSAEGFTPLALAAHFGHRETTEFLLAQNANASIVSLHPLQVTPIHAALFGRRIETARLLIEGGADVNIRRGGKGWPRAGWTALHYAAGYGLIELIEPLLARGAGLNTPDDEGQTPLGVAIEEKQDQAAEMLRQKGAQE